MPIVALLASGCGGVPAKSEPQPNRPIIADHMLLPSTRLIVGRIIAVDDNQRFAFVELVSDAPATALAPRTELMARAADLRTTGSVEVSGYIRGRTMGTKIVSGQPSPGDEVVWVAPSL